ncbi:ABC transporter, ATP-binding protein [Dictyocaulus viviparus]|uniref:ABC transporter, ATP-binding protein n=1 Tax=Dictyocaulus viviparus TaxID=29172 RepID=A0A0D8Y953_DICVI|nr:ABC transporter, ATP-binding protein [Dictyocaulus viviparus]
MFLSWYGISAHLSIQIERDSRLRRMCFRWRKNGGRRMPISILSDVYGTAGPGQLVAIMGSSGAGKTCLLNVLAHRNLDNLKIHGTIKRKIELYKIKVNQQLATKEFMRSACAYIQQDHCFIGSLTVKEHLMFNLGLEECADSIIGTRSIKGISGGEKKRVAFATEILTNPPILFCDEPTSGLDSFLALQIVNVLKNLAVTKSMTIMVTIHQPSSQVFELFDRIYLLTDGRVAFCGNQAEACDFWSELGDPLPRNFNPADHYISAIIDTVALPYLLYPYFRWFEQFRSLYWRSTMTVLREPTLLKVQLIQTVVGNARNKTRKWFEQFRSLYWRSTMTVLREPTLLKVQLIQTVVIAVLTGSVYLNNSYTQQKVANINGSLYQMITNMAFMFQFAVLHHFCSEMQTFYREYDSGLYTVSSFFIAKNMAELPNYTLSALVFSSILYWMSRLIPLWDAFVFYLLVGVLVQSTAISIEVVSDIFDVINGRMKSLRIKVGKLRQTLVIYTVVITRINSLSKSIFNHMIQALCKLAILGYAMGCIFGTVSTASAVLPIFVVPMMAFGGYFINQGSLPIYFYPFKFLSYFGYAYESLAVNEWSHVERIYGCEPPMRCYKNGSDVIKHLSFSPQNMWINVVILFLMIFIFRFIGFASLSIKARSRK